VGLALRTTSSRQLPSSSASGRAKGTTLQGMAGLRAGPGTGRGAAVWGGGWWLREESRWILGGDGRQFNHLRTKRVCVVVAGI
jgi:hypothetical protein